MGEPQFTEERCIDCDCVLVYHEVQRGDGRCDTCWDEIGRTFEPDPMEREPDYCGVIEFSETPEGYEARQRWAAGYDDLNGAPESEGDR